MKNTYKPKKVKNTTKMQKINKLSEMYDSWQTYSGQIQDNINILIYSNTQLNNSIEKYDNHLNKKLFLEMQSHPEKVNQYKSSNE